MALELSDRYKRILDERIFQSLLSHAPWPHFILDGLIEAESFRKVQKRIFDQGYAYEVANDHPAKLQLCYLQDVELAEFFFSEPVRRLLAGVAGFAIQPNFELAAQLRRMTPDSPAFPVHIDNLERESLVALYYIAPGWLASSGGEIVLVDSQRSSESAPTAKWIAPIANRLLLFNSASEHWHGVRRVQSWTRLTVLTEWIKHAQV